MSAVARRRPLRILFVSPAYYPAVAFGGPTWAARELNEGAVAHGNAVRVLTTTLEDVHSGVSLRTRRADLGGVHVTYLATPLRYRWMGITPTLPLELARAARPDVVHVYGFRDPLGWATAAWARRRRIPYVFDPLGMFEPRVRKVRLKRLLDSSLYRSVWSGAAAIVATSEHEKRQIVQAGVPAARIEIRGNGFPPPDRTGPTGILRRRLGLDGEQVVLYVGRIARGKGVEILLDAARRLPDVHVVLAGPDDGHGVMDDVRAAQADPRTAGRVHALHPETRPLDLYADADVFVLASEGESFGMVAAEAAAAGTPVVVTDRCGVSELLRPDGALVVPYDGDAVQAAVERLLADAPLRDSLRAAAWETAERFSWEAMVERQEEIYRLAIERGA
ncbi:MAG: hypothetical protein QOF75_1278 [Gaiellaceae bacterium]|nr:hypothetical protein [Gaiellaceae bacterium]